jgi:hypothetical protein
MNFLMNLPLIKKAGTNSKIKFLQARNGSMSSQ